MHGPAEFRWAMLGAWRELLLLDACQPIFVESHPRTQSTASPRTTSLSNAEVESSIRSDHRANGNVDVSATFYLVAYHDTLGNPRKRSTEHDVTGIDAAPRSLRLFYPARTKIPYRPRWRRNRFPTSSVTLRSRPWS